MKKPEDIQGHKGLKQDTMPAGSIKEPAIKKTTIKKPKKG